MQCALIGFAAWIALCVAGLAAAAGWPDLSQPPPAEGGGDRDAAVVIGIESYTYLAPVPGADDNAKDWYRWLKETRGVRAVKLLTDARATRHSILAAIDDATGRVGDGGTLWFVFIGHGAPSADRDDGVLVGAAAQQRVVDFFPNTISRGELLDALECGGQAETVVVLDACFSGRQPGGASLVPDLQPALVSGSWQPNRTTVLTAAQADQFAGPLPGTRRPAFSYLVLGALRGWGDRNGDRRVTAREAVDFASNALFEMVDDRTQIPSILGPSPDLVLARPSRPEDGPDLRAIFDAVDRYSNQDPVDPLPDDSGLNRDQLRCSVPTKAWEVTLEGDDWNIGCTVSELPGGAVAVFGIVLSDTFTGMRLVKLDPEGAVLWDRRYSSPFEHLEDECAGMVVLPDGHFVLAASAIDIHGDDFAEFTEGPWVVKLDPDGDLLWSWFEGERNVKRKAYAIAAYGGEEIMVAGNTFLDGGWEAWAVKLDQEGQPIFRSNLDGTKVGHLVGLLPTREGWVLGTSNAHFQPGGKVFWLDSWGAVSRTANYTVDLSSLDLVGEDGYVGLSIVASEDNRDRDIWLRRLDSTGAVVWEKPASGEEKGHSSHGTLAVTQDHGMLVGVNNWYAGEDGRGKSESWFVRVDSSGSLLWERNYVFENTELKEVSTTVDGGFLSTGYQSVDDQNRLFWVFRTSPECR